MSQPERRPTDITVVLADSGPMTQRECDRIMSRARMRRGPARRTFADRPMVVTIVPPPNSDEPIVVIMPTRE